jgi:hypothetical protein
VAPAVTDYASRINFSGELHNEAESPARETP